MITPEIAVSQEALADLCRRHRIRRMSFFGSVVRDDFGPDSDVDVLVEFEPGTIVGFRIFDIESELSQLLGGRKVDLVNPKYFNPRLRDRILASAEVQYAAGSSFCCPQQTPVNGAEEELDLDTEPQA